MMSLNGCSDELHPELTDIGTMDYSFKKINLMQLQKINSKAFTESTKLQKITNSKNKSIGSNNNYDLDLQNIQYTIRDNQDETFSFRIYQDPTATSQQNIVVDCKQNKTPQTYLITYNLSKSLNQIINNTDFKNAITSTTIVKIASVLKTGKNDTGGCLTVEVYDGEVDFCQGNLVTYGNEPHCFEKDGKTPRKIQVYKIVAASCSTASNSSFNPIGGQWTNNSPASNSTDPESTLNGNGVSIGDDSNTLNVFIPNYFTSDDLSDPAVQNRIQINFFINDLYLSNSGTKNIIDSTEWLLGYTNYWVDSNGGLTSSNKIALTYALTKLSMVVDQFSPTNYNMESLAAFKLTAFQFLLEHGQRLTQLDTQTQQNILRICTDFENIEFADETIQYQIDNYWSTESAVIANSLITAKFENPNMNFDVEASSKSPFNIDFSSINNATTEGAKFNEVYDALKESPEFKKLFIDLFDGPQTRFNVQFEINAITGGANGNTNTDLLNPTLNLITISTNFLKTANKLEIAKTIMHECIHAYLNIKLFDGGQGISISKLNNLDLFNLINEKYNGFIGKEDQHNFIYNFMLPTMEKILADVKDTLVTSADNMTMLQLIMHIPVGSNGTQFIWADFYHNLALSGLQNCSFFQNEIGTIDNTGQILTTINQTLMDAYNQYNNFGRLNLHP